MAAANQVMRNEELLSPFSRLFSLPGQDCFNIITIGCKTEGNPHAIVEGLKNTLINHPRFSSILVNNIYIAQLMLLLLFLQNDISSFHVMMFMMKVLLYFFIKMIELFIIHKRC